MNLPKYLKLTKKHNGFYLPKLTSTIRIKIEAIRTLRTVVILSVWPITTMTRSVQSQYYHYTPVTCHASFTIKTQFCFYKTSVFSKWCFHLLGSNWFLLDYYYCLLLIPLGLSSVFHGLQSKIGVILRLIFAEVTRGSP